jgi:hypothetical protein
VFIVLEELKVFLTITLIQHIDVLLGVFEIKASELINIIINVINLKLQSKIIIIYN